VKTGNKKSDTITWKEPPDPHQKHYKGENPKKNRKNGKNGTRNILSITPKTYTIKYNKCKI